MCGGALLLREWSFSRSPRLFGKLVDQSLPLFCHRLPKLDLKRPTGQQQAAGVSCCKLVFALGQRKSYLSGLGQRPGSWRRRAGPSLLQQLTACTNTLRTPAFSMAWGFTLQQQGACVGNPSCHKPGLEACLWERRATHSPDHSRTLECAEHHRGDDRLNQGSAEPTHTGAGDDLKNA